ncbi:MAG: hypothetical protein ACXW3C_02525 [Pyrinomonadaceae bacterium]
MEQERVLPKGTVVKVDGLPFERLEDALVFGQAAKGEAAHCNLAPASEDYA